MSPLITDPIQQIQAVQSAALPLTGSENDYQPLLELIGDAQYVLLGEASHGTHEFYQARADITKLLIKQKGFSVVALEADWPDTYRVNRYVKGLGEDKTARDALGDFERFPLWMWRNEVMAGFAEWLRDYNDSRHEAGDKVGIYGLDLYSLFRSIEVILAHLEKIDPEAARQAHYRYSCFEHFGEDPQAYGYATHIGISRGCEDEVIDQLLEMRRNAVGYMKADGEALEDELFYLEQNARIVKNAEEYYRTMFQGRNTSWNLRDRHMVETLENLVTFLDKRRTPEQSPVKVVVWAHNSHLGDARATEMGERGEWNIGQLVREKHEDNARLIGFSTYTGTVTAASHWDGATEVKKVQPGLEGSYEWLFYKAGLKKFLLPLRGQIRDLLKGPMLERAIGVIYHPHTERISHYFYAHLPQQFDAVFHFDETRGVRPLHYVDQWEEADLPETFPTGL